MPFLLLVSHELYPAEENWDFLSVEAVYDVIAAWDVCFVREHGGCYRHQAVNLVGDLVVDVGDEERLLVHERQDPSEGWRMYGKRETFVSTCVPFQGLCQSLSGLNAMTGLAADCWGIWLCPWCACRKSFSSGSCSCTCVITLSAKSSVSVARVSASVTCASADSRVWSWRYDARSVNLSWYLSIAVTAWRRTFSVVLEYFCSCNVRRLVIFLYCLVLCPLFAVKDSRISCSDLASKSYSSILTASVGLRG